VGKRRDTEKPMKSKRCVVWPAGQIRSWWGGGQEKQEMARIQNVEDSQENVSNNKIFFMTLNYASQ
jgi:hypothetical protein